MPVLPETRYAESGGHQIAYQIASEGKRDVLFVPRTTTPIDLLWDDPIAASGLRRQCSGMTPERPVKLTDALVLLRMSP
jgi:hypothetical protein